MIPASGKADTQLSRPRALILLLALILVLVFCGFLAWLDYRGLYIGGLIAIFDLLVLLALVLAIIFDDKASERRLSRRTRYAVDLALRLLSALPLLSPVDQPRYREEWAAELGDLHYRDQGLYVRSTRPFTAPTSANADAQPSRPPSLILPLAVILVLVFCGYLASLGGPGPYIAGLIAIVDLLVMLALVLATTPRDKASERSAQPFIAPTSAKADAEFSRPPTLILLLTVILVLVFCGYLAWLGGPGPYIGGMITIFDLVILALVSATMLRDRASGWLRLSRRTRYAVDLALRLLSPVDRQRYREEWAAELGDLPRRDQAPYAFRLLSHAWSLRRELSDKPRKNPRTALVIVGVVIPSADAVVALCGLDWPAATLGVTWVLGLLWVVSSKDRTQHLIALIREASNSKAPSRE